MYLFKHKSVFFFFARNTVSDLLLFSPENLNFTFKFRPVDASDKEQFNPAASKSTCFSLYISRDQMHSYSLFLLSWEKTWIIITYKEKHMEYKISDFLLVCGMTHLDMVPEEMGFCSLLWNWKFNWYWISGMEANVGSG